MIAPSAVMPHISFSRGQKRMTACLISLALALLVVIALWEECA